MTINLFEFPRDENRLSRELRLRPSLYFWAIFAVFLGIGVLFGSNLFFGPNRVVTELPPTQPNEWGVVVFFAFWMVAIVVGFLFNANGAVLDRHGLRFKSLLRKGRTVSLNEINAIDLDLYGAFRNSQIKCRLRGSRRQLRLSLAFIRDSDLRELCRAAGLSIVDKVRSH